MAQILDKELESYRNLMLPPDRFENGFTWQTIVGAVFLGFVMMPASMYAGLVIGGSNINDAARWVTVILFMEVAKRSFKELKQQEIFTLYYMSGLVLASPFQGLIFHQFMVQSEAARSLSLTSQIPSWIAPQPEIIAAHGRTFMTKEWLGPILLILGGNLIQIVDHFGLGYFLYRVTSDGEKLAFPMAPIGAAGAIALAEGAAEKTGWRWRVFSIGTMGGLCWGTIYFLIPTVTSAVFGKRVDIIPLPWIELTEHTNKLLPGVATGIMLDLTLFVLGMVLPFWAVVGTTCGVLVTMIMNPTLQRYGLLPHWEASMTTAQVAFSNQLDFYLSFSIGIALAIAGHGIGRMILQVIRSRGKEDATGLNWRAVVNVNKNRGDISIWVSLSIYLFSTLGYSLLALYLVPGLPVWILVFYGFVYTPIISYASARLEGMAGQSVSIPYIREVTFILSGVRGANVWFAPFPINDYGRMVTGFRQVELTGTDLRSIIKTQILATVVILSAGLMFSEFMWNLADIPSDQFPYAQQTYELEANQRLLVVTSTTGAPEDSPFWKAFSPMRVGIGLAVGLVILIGLQILSAPIMLGYGLMRGMLTGIPHNTWMECLGAFTGRYVLRRRFGPMWQKYTPVLYAGLMCGQGLIMLGAVAITMIAKSVSQMTY
ncbi:MAG TPA: OPT/YSL family transporter [Planctomycetota bacterium]|nr:OPT/YSL family transporter [Planctomycetota bacterium]